MPTALREVAGAEPRSSPEISPEPGWVAIDLATFGGAASFVSGPGNGNRIRVRYYRCEPEGTLSGKVWFGPDAEGPLGHAHSGSLSAVLEDAMGLAAWVGGFAVVTVAVTVHFRQMVPLGQVCTLGSWVSRVDAQEVHVRGLLAGPAGQAFADADGSYLIIQDQVRQC